MKRYYTAVIHKDEGNSYWVEFPNLQGCVTGGDSFERACFMAEDALGEWISTKEEYGDIVTEPTEYEEIKKQYPNDIVQVFGYDDVQWKKEHATKPVHKTVSLPQWLFELANEKGISLSKTLQKALKEELGL